MEWLLHFGWLVPLGFVVGAYGTLIGAGGGFILVPLLLLIYPHERPEVIASISLAVVFFNTASGSYAYARLGRIDYRAALIFALATIPGAVIGALTTSLVPRRAFDVLLGGLMLTLGLYLGLRPRGGAVAEDVDDAADPTWRHSSRRRYTIGALLSLAVGYVSSLLGMGGGIVHVPALARVLRYPIHTATATSHLILAVMALSGTCVHIANGDFQHGGLRRTIALSIGVVLGAQIGAFISNRLHGAWILRGLALGLLVLSVRLLEVGLAT